MDIIFIHELRVQTLIGVYPQEREARQTLALDLELGTDIRPAAATDRLSGRPPQPTGLMIRSITRLWRSGLKNLPPPAISSWWKPSASGSPNCY